MDKSIYNTTIPNHTTIKMLTTQNIWKLLNRVVQCNVYKLGVERRKLNYLNY